MPKISALPPVAEVDGNETVVLVKDGATRRGAIGDLVSTAAAPYVAAAEFAAATAVSASSFFGSAEYGGLAGAIAAGEAATSLGELFSVDDGEGILVFRARTAGGSLEVGRFVTPAALASNDGAAMVFMKQIEAGSVRRNLKAKLGEILSVTDFGAVGDGEAISTDAFRTAIEAARVQGKDLFVPPGAYVIDEPLEILFDPARRGLRIYSGNSGSYYTEDRHATIRYIGEADFCVRIVGPETGDGAPAFVKLDGLRFIGNNSCPGAVLIQRSWHVGIRNCSFTGFGNVDGGGITLRASGPTGFTGVIDIEKCTFASCGRNIKLTGNTGGQINVVRIVGCKGVDQKNAVFSDWAGQLPFTTNVKIRDCLWEGSTGIAIASDGVAGNWTIEGGYIEDSNPLTPIRFDGGGNYGINVQGMFFRKSALAAGQALTFIINGTNCRFSGNSSGFGNQVDRFSADFVVCKDSFAAPADGIAITPYPVRMNNYIKAKAVTSDWFSQMPKGPGQFCGISSGDGWPGGTSCVIQDEISIDNSLVRISGNVTIDEKSPAGELVLIGLLPYRNGFYNRAFPVYTQNVVGDGPFFAVLPGNGFFATVYDRNRVPLNYQTAVSEGSYFEFTFDYLADG